MAAEGVVLEAALTDLWRLSLDTSYSLLRMSVALLFSYAFAIPYGVAAARSKRAERILMPLLDTLQSIPILGFFPAAILFFIAVFHETWIGVELAAVFLIFTSQAWNLAFAVYESVSAIPSDLDEAASSLRLRGISRFRVLYIPASVPKLVYDGMMSWSNGWYFLVAAEIITLGSKRYSLPGVGRYLAEATYAGNYQGTILGLVALVFTITVFDALLWRPLRGYADRFRYEAVSSEQAVHHTLFHASTFAWLKSHLRLPRHTPSIGHPPMVSATRLTPLVKGIRYIAGRPMGFFERHIGLLISLLAATLISASLIAGFRSLVELPSSLQMLLEDLQSPTSLSEIQAIPAALGSSLTRILLAYLLSLAWTLPLAVKVASGKRALEASASLMQVLASIPATALFPLIILATMNLPGGLQLTSVILTMTGMQWYLLFNLIGGVRSIPSDLIEASSAFRVRGLERWRRLMVPAILPSLVTGSITAWGGAWNALVVSEYMVFSGEALSVPGVGAMLDRAAYETGSVSLLFIAITVMVTTILAMNRLFWRRLYRFVLTRYRMDY